MSPPAATAAARRARRRPSARTVAPRIPRRVSGPLRARTAPRARASVALPLGVRLAAFASTLPDRGIVDRMVRGRAWIAVVGTLLIGLVAMQVSLLKLNAGIGTDVERAAGLERTNGELRAQVSELESGARIQEQVGGLGMVMPPAGQISYLTAGGQGTAAAAAGALADQRFNDPSKAQPLPGGGAGSDASALLGTTATGAGASSTGSSSTDSSSTTSSTDSGSTDSGSTATTAGTSTGSTSGTTSTDSSSTDAGAAGGTSSGTTGGQ